MPHLSQQPPARTVRVLVGPGVPVQDLALARVFERANLLQPGPAYEVALVSARGAPVATAHHFSVETQPWDDSPVDTLIVAGGDAGATPSSQQLAALRAAAGRVRRIAGVGAGCFALAAAGLLDGRRATTQRQSAQRFQQQYPQVRYTADLPYVHDGALWTASGSAAGLALAQALVCDDLGDAAAQQLARALAIEQELNAGLLRCHDPIDVPHASAPLRAAMAFARVYIAHPISAAALARAADLGLAQLTRLFLRETGLSPSAALRRLRVAAASCMIEQGSLSLDEVSRACGFGSRSVMRAAFLRVRGLSPQEVAWRGADRAGAVHAPFTTPRIAP